MVTPELSTYKHADVQNIVENSSKMAKEKAMRILKKFVIWRNSLFRDFIIRGLQCNYKFQG